MAGERVRLSSATTVNGASGLGLLKNVGKFLTGRFTGGRGAAKDQWPFIPGKYHVVDANACVVVTTSASHELAADVAALAPPGLCLVAALRSEGDVERLIRNISSNLSIQHLVAAGDDDEKQPFGASLLALCKGNGDDLGEAGARIVQLIR
jgi:tetrahydromethanopterin S-methyltransferase subunit A